MPLEVKGLFYLLETSKQHLLGTRLSKVLQHFKCLPGHTIIFHLVSYYLHLKTIAQDCMSFYVEKQMSWNFDGSVNPLSYKDILQLYRSL